MPRDITAQCLTAHPTDREFRRNAGGAPRREVESGKLRIVKAGDGSVHPIEAEYLAPEVHSLMKMDRPVVRAADLDRVVLLVSEPMHELQDQIAVGWRYLQLRTDGHVSVQKSQGKPLPERSTCAARSPWYDLTSLVRPGIAFWPMSQQYRHIIAANPERLICNHNLFAIAPAGLSRRESTGLVAVLNSTLVGLFKTFYGRFAGTEGNLKTEVVDVNLLEVPDPRGVPAALTQRLTAALGAMSKREVGRLVEEQLMDCHTPERARRIAAGPVVLPLELQQHDRRDLDDAVFELLGVSRPCRTRRTDRPAYTKPRPDTSERFELSRSRRCNKGPRRTGDASTCTTWPPTFGTPPRWKTRTRWRNGSRTNRSRTRA